MSNAYDNASLLVTPNGYEAGTIFSAKPTDGSGDLTFSRASTALRRNSAGLWESVANNVPRLNYPVGSGCPSWLFEPQATCLIPSSNVFTGDTTKTTGITDSPISGLTSVRLTKTSAPIEYAVTSYSATITNSTPYVASLYFKYDGYNIDSSLEFNNGGDFGQSWRANIEIRSTGITISSFVSCTAVLVAEANGWYRLEVSITTETVTANSGSILIKAAGASGASFLVTTSNLTEGSVATSPIITAGSAVTRLKDVGESTVVLTENNTVYYECSVNALGVFLCDFKNNSLGRQFVAFTATDGRVLIDNYQNDVDRANNSTSSGIITANTKFKFCVVSTATSRILFVNGVKYDTINESFSGGDRIFNQQTFTDPASMNNNNLLIYYTTNLSDSEAIALTTL